MKLKTHTFGCKVNQYETQFVREALLKIGCANELIVINTCTVTSQSDLKCRKGIRKIIKENPNAEIVVMGCLAKANPNEIRKIPGISKILASDADVNNFLLERGLNAIPTGIENYAERHRAFVKVQDGCQNGCSYCIIPLIRSVLYSRPIPHILAEIAALLKNGYKEIVLTGINLGQFQPGLTELLRSILLQNVEFQKQHCRIRLSSIEASEASDELIDFVAANTGKICPHFHLPLQSGSSAILRQMNRRFGIEPFIERCEYIRRRIPDVALTTDVIVGFPGETETDFEETCSVVRKLRFSKVHIFRYSPRAGTPAAAMPNQISPVVQKERANKLQEIADSLRKEYAESMIGKIVQILVEGESGTTEHYLEASLPSPHNLDGQLVFKRFI